MAVCSMFQAHFSGGLEHEWMIFPVRYVSLPEGIWLVVTETMEFGLTFHIFP